MKKPVNVAITGAAGQIGYALAFRVASGAMLGPDQPVNLHLLEITPALPQLNGVVMELSDCAFPTLNSVSSSTAHRSEFCCRTTRRYLKRLLDAIEPDDPDASRTQPLGHLPT